MRLSSTLAVSAAVLSSPAWSWGDEGHKITATIAQIHLFPSAQRAVCNILPKEYNCSLAAVASWPDEVKKTPQWRWSAGLHFVNGVDDYPPENCTFGQRGWQEPFNNILHAIVNTTRNLTDPIEQVHEHIRKNKNISVTFLTHYLGDLHQPLHLAGRALGGNMVPVLYEKNETNLHSVWDNFLIPYRIRTLKNYTTPLPTSSNLIPSSTLDLNKRIESTLTGSAYDPLVRWIVLEGIYGWWADEHKEWANCPQLGLQNGGEQTVMQKLPFEDPLDLPVCPYYWSVPSHQMLCDFIWRPEFKGVENMKNATYDIQLEKPEYAGRIRDEKSVERQLALGGMRLAATLNTVLGSKEEKLQFGTLPKF